MEGRSNDPNLGAHSDLNLVTLLYQNDVNGLEIQNNDGEWIKVKFSPHSFIVVIGDSLSVLLNGRLPSPYHRVMMAAGNDKTRYSAGFFSYLKGGCEVKIPEELVNEQNPLLFKPFDFDEFFTSFLSEVRRGSSGLTLKTYCAV
ncbi:Isopenicillin N synthase [Corchorus olitorius]|uniref:Isopenicillin N synthase n=1 Tax=Corchorus olitorius TaxID=93759 RepID=A0A1R3HAV3_9ROSI|nr:Isopenicillin N synthase [Corchorus olitorius]